MNNQDQRIRALAYQIWEAEGKPEGQAERHWEKACKLAESETQDECPPSPPSRKVSKPKEVPSVLRGKTKEEKPALLKKPRTTSKASASKTPKPE
nr:DUF2934 domain-containing protein [uncultured Pseudomonas sp.]